MNKSTNICTKGLKNGKGIPKGGILRRLCSLRLPRLTARPAGTPHKGRRPLTPPGGTAPWTPSHLAAQCQKR